jgi:hypothetical protein
MKVIGLITVVIVALVVLIGVVVGLRSIPDVRRYLKIRAM